MEHGDLVHQTYMPAKEYEIYIMKKTREKDIDVKESC